jgi:hypothetical protein
MEVIHFSETPVQIQTKRLYIPNDGNISGACFFTLIFIFEITFYIFLKYGNTFCNGELNSIFSILQVYDPSFSWMSSKTFYTFRLFNKKLLQLIKHSFYIFVWNIYLLVTYLMNCKLKDDTEPWIQMFISLP